jgi:hypothetical protein
VSRPRKPSAVGRDKAIREFLDKALVALETQYGSEPGARPADIREHLLSLIRTNRVSLSHGSPRRINVHEIKNLVTAGHGILPDEVTDDHVRQVLADFIRSYGHVTLIYDVAQHTRRRGAPNRFSDVEMQMADKMKLEGYSNRDVASILYDGNVPTRAQVNGIPVILKRFRKKLQSQNKLPTN